MMKFQSSDHVVFFGGTASGIPAFQQSFPQLAFKRIKQTHSDLVVEASDSTVEADAHFTGQKNQALVIATADCMPIMIYCRQTLRVASVHAGWKGVQNQITAKTLQRLIDSGSTKKDFKIYIGPHILQPSFEVSEDVFTLLSLAQYGLQPQDYSKKVGEKYFVDLNRIVKSQIEQTTKQKADIVFVNADTKTDTDYYSYRRDQKTKERNLSFIALT